jgi:hypothetical protein
MAATKRTKLTVSIPAQLHAEMQNYCKTKHKTIKDFVEGALDQALTWEGALAAKPVSTRTLSPWDNL